MTLVEKQILEEVRANDDVEPCDHGKYLRCEACVERNYQQGIGVGIDQAWKVVALAVTNQASDLFIKGLDDRAREIRSLLAKLEAAVNETRSPKKAR